MNSGNPRRTRLAGMALLAVVFVAGMLAGAAFGGRVLSAREPAAPSAQACRTPERGGRHLFEQLDLSPAQRARIDSIMARRRARTDSLWRTDGARIRASVDTTRAEIRAVLTPEQAVEYDRLREEHERKRRDGGRPKTDSAGAGR